ncbi:MAG: 3-phosphoserine/phosphohydroxythreonine transaminase [Planctomycetales bacterium]|nr:3-phosphoserine/phosphohydroxythreonine transaminase [Planctomycetales bacterium]
MIYKVTTTRKPTHTGIDAPRTAAYHTSSPNSPSLSTDAVTVQRIHNFSAGPAVLPEPVLSAAREHLLSLGETGIGILEHSHRGDTFGEVLSSAETRIRRLANIPDDVAVLFLQGGASLQFAMGPANLRPANTIADYIISGTWSLKAMEAAQSDGAVHVASSSQDSVFRSLPGPPQCSDSPAYLHYTSNNTIAGTQFSTPPNPPSGVPLVCDASSDIFSRPIDLNAHDLVYAGAQKNLGPAGLTLVMIRRTLLDTAVDSLPAINRYITHANAGSLYNTPPVFSIFVTDLVLEWLEEQGGLSAIAERNRTQASRLYERIDASRVLSGRADISARSLMNVVFSAGSQSADDRFVEHCHRAGLVGLRGHRSVGGLRASLYNAQPDAAVDRLLEVIDAFEAEQAE